MFVVYANYSHIDFLNFDYIESMDLSTDELSPDKNRFRLLAWGPSSDFEDNSERSQYELVSGSYEECLNCSNAIIEAMKNKEKIVDIRDFYVVTEEGEES